MRRLLAVSALLAGLAQGFVPTSAKAQEAELTLFGAMLEAPEGAPMATATAVGGSPGAIVFVTSAKVAGVEGACLRNWTEGACHPLAPGAERFGELAIIVASVPEDEMLAKMTANPINQIPRVGAFDPQSDAPEVVFVTQSDFGGWERPPAPASVVGVTAAGIRIQQIGLSDKSIGAPVVHVERGLIGVIAKVSGDSALVLPIEAVVEAVQKAGHEVPDMMRPQDAAGGELPRAVENELGRLIVFSDNTYIGQGMTGFYAPSQGVGFDESFVATIRYSVYGVDPSGPSARFFAGFDKALPLVPAGMVLEAPTRETPPDLVASCIIHATPSSQGREALVIQFWRAVPARYNEQIDDKSYDEAAPPITGWVKSPDECANRIADMGPSLAAALRGETVAPEDTASSTPAPAPPSDSAGSGAAWSAFDPWAPTGLPAMSITFSDGRVLTLGCTESRELVLALTPAGDAGGFLVGGKPAREEGRSENTAYGFFPASVFAALSSGASIGFSDGGKPFDLEGPPDLADSFVGLTCRE